jgi:hypothetical protein
MLRLMQNGRIVTDNSEAQVSWKGIEAGARLVTAGGEEIGSVDEVVGDPQVDIFDGLVVSPPGHHAGHRDKRYVAAERVGRIWPDRVEVDFAADELASLSPYTEPKNVTWRPSQGGGITGRLRSAGKDLFGRRPRG